MKNKGSKIFKFVLYLIIGLFVFLKAVSFIDPDFGWHLTTGNLILKSGFPKVDPFSYTMPSFPFIEHEWLADVIFAKLYPLTGLTGISVLSSILFLSAILISVSKAKKLTMPLFLVGMSSLIPFFTDSPKVFSWLFFSVFIYAVFNKTFWKKYWFLTPLIFILWANFHGSFSEGLIILLVISICKSFREKRIWLKGVLTVFLSFLATLVNPYGFSLWKVVWQTVSDPLLKFRIVEWQPVFSNPFAVSFLAILLFSFSVVILFKYRHKFRVEEIILNFIFFAQAIFAVRNITYWVLFDLPMVAIAVNHFYNEVTNSETVKGKIREKRFLVVSRFAILLSAAFFIFQFLEVGYTYLYSHNENIWFSNGAISFLQKNLPSGQIFSHYNWGGYLIWKLPEKKVFIYGMMPSWRWQENFLGESTDAMGDYINVTTGKIPYKSVFEKYNIDTVLLSTRQENIPSKDVLYGELTKDNWRIMYQDSVSVIFEKPD